MRLLFILLCSTFVSCAVVMPKDKRAVEPKQHVIIKRNVGQCPKGYVKCNEGHCHKAVRPKYRKSLTH